MDNELNLLEGKMDSKRKRIEVKEINSGEEGRLFEAMAIKNKNIHLDCGFFYRSEPLESALAAEQLDLNKLVKVTPVIIEKKEEVEVENEKSSSGEVNEEVTSYFTGAVVTGNGNGEAENDHLTKKDKLSQLRQLLEKNLKTTASPSAGTGVAAADSSMSAAINSAFRPTAAAPSSGGAQPMQIDSVVAEPVDTDAGTGKPAWGPFPTAAAAETIPPNVAVTVAGSSATLCQRRRVSFNPLVVQDTSNSGNGGGGGGNGIQLNSSQQGTNSHHPQQTGLSSSSSGGGAVVVSAGGGGGGAGGGGGGGEGGGGGGLSHPSPGTRKRHFSFQPISPRQNSLPQSPVASPFISPRSTPVHMLRSRHSSGSALPLHLLPQAGKSAAFNSASSDISRAATFGSTSECSTPFISPHGTPVPFSRSGPSCNPVLLNQWD